MIIKKIEYQLVPTIKRVLYLQILRNISYIKHKKRVYDTKKQVQTLGTLGTSWYRSIQGAKFSSKQVQVDN